MIYYNKPSLREKKEENAEEPRTLTFVYKGSEISRKSTLEFLEYNVINSTQPRNFVSCTFFSNFVLIFTFIPKIKMSHYDCFIYSFSLDYYYSVRL